LGRNESKIPIRSRKIILKTKIMAKAKKTKEENLEPIGEIKMREVEKLEQCEWVFQFDEDEPQIFAWTGDEQPQEDPTVTFTISNTKGAYISFTSKETGKTFRMFARELSEQGLILRDYQNKLAKNESTNKEA
jgi:hypothetical protein